MWIRWARPDDDAALSSMLGRCSKQTRYHRFHGFARVPATYLRQCLSEDQSAQRALVAEPVTAGAPRLVGLASSALVPGAPRVREVAALVEDEWQRLGVGRRLMAELFADAYLAGVELIRMQLCREQRSLLTYVLARARVVSTCTSGCDVMVEMAVPAPREYPFRKRTSPAEGTAP
jgi:GNAT superfamily N-acetyltransferase